MKVAIVHDYLNQLGGAERVVGVLHQMYPDAPIYTLLADHNKLWPSLQGAIIHESLVANFPLIKNHFKWFFWLYPLAIRTLRIPETYDVVISSSSAFAKGFSYDKRNRPLHLCYCYTPMRFAWDFDRYIENETQSAVLRKLAKLVVPWLKRWDLKSSSKVDRFIAISSTIQARIQRIYGREADIVFPPVSLNTVSNFPTPREYFLVVSRLVSYKRIDLAVQACTNLNKRLLVLGEGPDKTRLQKLAGPAVEFLGWQPDEKVTDYMQHCKALLFPGEEDFGITPVEVNTLGRPVIAYKGGGALDTIQDGVNGVFFSEPTVSSLERGIARVDEIEWQSEKISSCATHFAEEVFCNKISLAVKDLWHVKQKSYEDTTDR